MNKQSVLEMVPLGIQRFGTGEVARILGTPIWRLQKFLDSPRYQLSPSGQLGVEGKGSRRMFSKQDVWRLGIAAFLIKDGFAPKFVARILEEIEDNDLLGHDHQGEETSSVIILRRGVKGAQLELFQSGRAPKIEGDLYYKVDLGEIIDRISARISKARTQGRR